MKTWTLSFPGSKINNGPKAERKAKIINPKVLLRGPGTSVDTDSEMLGAGAGVISEQVLHPLFNAAKAVWDPSKNQAHSIPWRWAFS